MPRVKIDYVVSFSSEDPEHPASNLLAWEVSKKKWLCQKGETSCSVVLQLTKAIKISSVHIGAYHSALVEVLVARSENASDQFQVLVPSCVFVPPGECRRDAAVERVRSFSGAALAAGARERRWDRLRVVCAQPYNKHCKYGLSFIHIDGEGPAAQGPAAPGPALALAALSSDEDDFRPGELFAQHLQKNTDSQSSANSDTGAQIRQATSQALKNIPESSTKLVKTPMSKPSSKRDNHHTLQDKMDRSRDTLLYTEDDEQPHSRIDQVVQRHKDQREKEDKAKPQTKHDRKEKERITESVHKHKEEKRTPKRRKSELSDSETSARKKPNKNSDDAAASSSDKNRTDERRKRSPSIEEMEQDDEDPPEPHEILKGVVLVLSGYQNPQRANVRNTALALGARVERDWGPSCTHLVCAFPNTPKLREVRARERDAPAVLAEWVQQCSARRRRLPWRWFATERGRRQAEPRGAGPAPRRPARARPQAAAPPETSRAQHDSDTECDTDEEIQKVVQKQKAKLAAADESGPSTDEAEAEPAPAPRLGGALPDFLDGYTVAIDDAERDARLLARYVAAYGGLPVQLSQLSDSEVDFVVSSRRQQSAAPRHLPPAWLAACHRAQRLLPRD